MSLDNITNEYNNKYNLKNNAPAWIAPLYRDANNRNISVTDWNSAVDDIRKTASDSKSVYEFIQALNTEFNAYYLRNIKNIYYTTDTEDKLKNVVSELSLTEGNFVKDNGKVHFNIAKLDTYLDTSTDNVFYCSNYENNRVDVGFTMTFAQSTFVKNLQLYVRGVYTPVNIVISMSSDGTAYSKSHTEYLHSRGGIDTYLVPVGMYVKSIKIIQPKLNGATQGRFSICGIELFKSNVTGTWILERFDGTTFKIPMVDPKDFAETMQNSVASAQQFSKAASDYSVHSSAQAKLAEVYTYGTMDGEVVDYYADKHAKYYKEQAAGSALAAEKAKSDTEQIKTDTNDLVNDFKDTTTAYLKDLKDSTYEEIADLLIARDAEWDEESAAKVSQIYTEAKQQLQEFVSDTEEVISKKLDDIRGITEQHAKFAAASSANALVSEQNALSYAKRAESAQTSAANSLKTLKQTIADTTDLTNTANKLLRLDDTGRIPAQLIPHESVVDVFRITEESQLDTLENVSPGDIAYLVIPVMNENGAMVDTITKSWRYYGGAGYVHPAWILQSTTDTSNALYSENATNAYNAERINGVLVRFGNIDTYSSEDHEGLWIITDYSESEA